VGRYSNRDDVFAPFNHGLRPITTEIVAGQTEFNVPSETNSGTYRCYPVSWPGARDGFYCPCKAFRFSTDCACKHTSRIVREFTPEVKVVGYKRKV
jgi:hypothetical protein